MNTDNSAVKVRRGGGGNGGKKGDICNILNNEDNFFLKAQEQIWVPTVSRTHQPCGLTQCTELP